MKVIEANNEKEMSQQAAAILIEKVRKQPSVTLGLATGSTPKGTYRELISDHLERRTSYKNVTTINLDEYIGLPAENPNSFRHFMDEQLFKHLDIDKKRTYLPDGMASDLSKECERYDILIEQSGGIDLQVLGIGENGHIGFNEPGSSFQSLTHVVALTASTRKANARFFGSPEDVPEQAITLGIQSILQSGEILLLASGSSKAHAIKRLISGGVGEDFPASALKLHDRVTLIADQEALALA